ncbi:MAG: phage tail protein, partial [Bdellovibrionales bacterium]
KLITTVFFLCLTCPSAAFATAYSSQDSDGNIQFVFDNASSIKIAPSVSGSGGGACSSSSAGAIRYVPATGTFEGCNGATWGSLAGSSMPSGAVMAFYRSSCPSGWIPATYMAGRVIIGVGASGAAGSTYHPLTQSGGEETHTLSLYEMPAHNHGIAEYAGRAGQEIPYSAHLDSRVNGASSATTTYSGASYPHNNMPPYTTLLYCQKT